MTGVSLRTSTYTPDIIYEVRHALRLHNRALTLARGSVPRFLLQFSAKECMIRARQVKLYTLYD